VHARSRLLNWGVFLIVMGLTVVLSRTASGVLGAASAGLFVGALVSGGITGRSIAAAGGRRK